MSQTVPAPHETKSPLETPTKNDSTPAPKEIGAESPLSPKVDTEESKPGHSTNQSQEATEANDWGNDWWTHHNWWGEGRWSHTASQASEHSQSLASENHQDEPNKTPVTEVSTVWADQRDTPRHYAEPGAKILTSPSKTDTGRETMTNATFRVDQVNVQTKTQSMEVTREHPPEQQTLLALRKLALTGPPLNREDRLARQVMANRLSLTPELYNLLVFGETDDAGTVPRIATCAFPPPGPSESP